jgi:hypothetical protein
VTKASAIALDDFDDELGAPIAVIRRNPGATQPGAGQGQAPTQGRGQGHDRAGSPPPAQAPTRAVARGGSQAGGVAAGGGLPPACQHLFALLEACVAAVPEGAAIAAVGVYNELVAPGIAAHEPQLAAVAQLLAAGVAAGCWSQLSSVLDLVDGDGGLVVGRRRGPASLEQALLLLERVAAAAGPVAAAAGSVEDLLDVGCWPAACPAAACPACQPARSAPAGPSALPWAHSTPEEGPACCTAGRLSTRHSRQHSLQC